MERWRGLDIETQGDKPLYGLQPHRLISGEAVISAISVAGEESILGKLYPSVSFIRKLLVFSSKQKLPLVGWNTAFDVSWLIAAGLEEEVFACQWLDAMLFWKHWINEPTDEFTPKAQRQSFSLAAALKQYFPDQADFKEFEDFDATDEESLKQLLHRNKNDALFTLKLAKIFYQELTPKQRVAAMIEACCIPQFARTSVQGLAINEEQCGKLDIELEIQGQTTYNNLLEENPEVSEVNLGSSQQLGHLLFNQWGLPILKTSKKTGEPSTDKEVLYELAAIDPRADAVKVIRETKNNRTKFVTAIRKSVEYNEDGFVRPQPRVFGTYTGRATYNSTMKDRYSKPQKEYQTGFAIHQTKRDASFREIIIPPEGYDLVELDFAGQEFRWMAVASEDETMLELCAPGEDPHAFMGAQIAQRDYRDLQRLAAESEKQAKNDRNLGKFSNLSFQYRIGSDAATSKARVQYKLNVEEAFIKEILAVYKGTYPGVPRYWQNQIVTCRNKMYAETVAGRRVALTGWTRTTAWKKESTAINFPIQGAGADQKYLALAIARNELPQFGGHVYFELHDGLFFIFPKAKTKQATVLLRDKLSALPYKRAWGCDLPILFPVDAKIGPSWGALENFDG